jgi:hypothetical protein
MQAMKRTTTMLAALAGIFLATTAAAPQDEWVAQVRRILQQTGHVFEERGFSMTHRIYTGALNDDSNEMVSIDLDIGTEYKIMGACDTDCTDVDFVLYDPAGNQIDQDVLTDDAPIVGVTPRRSGTYRVKVIMAACSREPCRYGVAVFGK